MRNKKKQEHRLSTIWQKHCGKVYEHECYSKECNNIINAHNFIVDSLYYVPICYQCNELFKNNPTRDMKSNDNEARTKNTYNQTTNTDHGFLIQNTQNSIGTQYYSNDHNFTVEDIPIQDNNDTCSGSNDLEISSNKKKKKKLFNFLFFR